MICYFHGLKSSIEYFEIFEHKNTSSNRKKNSICFCRKERYEEVVWLRNDEKKDILKCIHIEIIHNNIIKIWLTTNTLINDVIQVMMVFLSILL